MEKFATRSEFLAKNVTNTLTTEMANISNFFLKADMNNTKILSNTKNALTALNFLLGYMT